MRKQCVCLVANDFPAYIEIRDDIEQTYKDKDKWNRMSIMSLAGSEKFASDRTIEQYAKEIWEIEPLPVSSLEQTTLNTSLLGRV